MPNEVNTPCHRKKGWCRYQDAARTRDRWEGGMGKGFRVYLCPHCGLYHLTSQDPKRPDNGRRECSSG
jgi:hypothetical protein